MSFLPFTATLTQPFDINDSEATIPAGTPFLICNINGSVTQPITIKITLHGVNGDVVLGDPSVIGAQSCISDFTTSVPCHGLKIEVFGDVTLTGILKFGLVHLGEPAHHDDHHDVHHHNKSENDKYIGWLIIVIVVLIILFTAFKN